MWRASIRSKLRSTGTPLIMPISAQLLRRAGAHGPIALVYHSIAPGSATPRWKWSVSIKRFQEQLDLLLDCGFEAVTISELARSTTSKNAKKVAITFDDGYADNFAAVEELAKRGMTATLFVVTGAIGGPATWQTSDVARPMLSALQLRHIQTRGFEIGSHTVSHSRLTELNQSDIKCELRGSRQQLEELIEFPVLSFAFPFGAYNDDLVATVREAGYSAACNTDSGWAMRDDDPFRIRRISVFATDTVSAFSRKLLFADNQVEWTRVPRYLIRASLRKLSK